MGLYQKSAKLAQGERVRLSDMLAVKARSGGQMLFVGLLLTLLALIWLRAAVLVYALFFGYRAFPGADEFIPLIIGTPAGWGMLATGIVVGGLFAALGFAVSAFSIPMLLDRRTDALSAMGTSMALVWNNLPGYDARRIKEPKMDAPAAPLELGNTQTGSARDLLFASQSLGSGRFRTSLSVPGMHCGGCMSKVEKTLSALPDVEMARANLSTKRATVEWKSATVPPLLEALETIGFDAHLVDNGPRADPHYYRLIRALAVAGFAAANIMMLSVAVWAGADAATRELFHWLSAAIAMPTLLFSGRVFFSSARNALRHGRSNMDVPISVGVILAFGLSLYETVVGGEHAYFDASVTLLFFLLVGRTLDHAMRERARSAVKGLASLTPRGASVVQEDGRYAYCPVSEIVPGMTLALAAGERLPVDGTVMSGTSLFDCAMVTGEGLPVSVGPGDQVRAGTLNLQAPLHIKVLAAAKDSFLSEMMRLVELAENGRNRYRRLADRVSELYSPIVHLAALLTGLVWLMVSGDWHMAVTTAIAVLIITCPCALGLAVPIVHVVAARRLFETGVLTKDGSAIERLSQVDTIVFDKTGTLTSGHPVLKSSSETSPEILSIALALAQASRHPLSVSIARSIKWAGSIPSITDVNEEPGAGVSARIGETSYRLGKRVWACETGKTLQSGPDPEVVLSRVGVELATFRFTDNFRSGAHETVAKLKRDGFKVEILDQLAQEGRTVLMVGDGLNDAPSLAAAHVSIAPSSAADIGRQAADMVFTRPSLTSVREAIVTARKADRLVRQNLAAAVLYNGIAVPIAVLGYVTPLVAALAMSLSSIIVVANAMRLSRSGTAVKDPEAARYHLPLEAV
eukprot:jgi/Tetstr1/450323/TSEL_037359.t1